MRNVVKIQFKARDLLPKRRIGKKKNTGKKGKSHQEFICKSKIFNEDSNHRLMVKDALIKGKN